MAINGRQYDWEDAAAVGETLPQAASEPYGWRQTPGA